MNELEELKRKREDLENRMIKEKSMERFARLLKQINELSMRIYNLMLIKIAKEKKR